MAAIPRDPGGDVPRNYPHQKNHHQNIPIDKEYSVLAMNIVRRLPILFLWTIALLTGMEAVCAQEAILQPAAIPSAGVTNTVDEKGINPSASSSTKLLFTPEEQAWLAKDHRIRVRYWQHPPYFYLKDGVVVGVSVDLLNAVAENTGLTFQFENRLERFSDVLKELIEHQSPDVVAAIMPTPERQKTILFTQPYINSPRFIFTRDDTPFVSSIEKLFDKKIAVVRDYVTHKTLVEMFPGIDLLVLDNNEAALRAVSTGEAAAFIGDLVSTPVMINEFGLKNLKVVSPSGLPDHPLAMGIRNDWPELRDILDKGLAAIPAAEKAAIFNKWSSVKFDHGISPAFVWTWVLIIATVVSGILLLFLLWTKSLKKQVRHRTAELNVTNRTLEIEIAERKQAAEALTKSEQKYRNLVDNSLIGVFNTDLAGQFSFVNDAMVQIYEFDSTAQMLASNSHSLWANLEHREQMLSLLIKHGKVTNYEAETVTHTGKRIHVLFSATLFEERIAGMGMDITERKQTEQKLQQYQQRLKSLAVQLTLAEEQERRRIAEDLHDHVGQSLALARMQLAAARKGLPQSDQRDARLDDISQSLLKAIQDTRHLIFELSSPSLNELGLAAAISEWMDENVVNKHGIKAELFDHARELPLNSDLRAILFRNVRELLTNAIKHARAETISVWLESRAENLEITVQDDGVGFDYGNCRRSGDDCGGFGLFSVRERMADFDGNLTITSQPGAGCKAVLLLPIHTLSSYRQ